MDVPLRVSFHNMDASDAVEARVRERVSRLERFFDRITSCRVVVEAPHRRHHKGKHYLCRIELVVPGKELIVNRDPRGKAAHEDVYVAIRDAFDALQRQLQDYARGREGKIKTHEAPNHGRVVRLFPREGYGFAEAADGQEIYFHRNAVIGAGFDCLEGGSVVRLVVAEGESDKGPQATTVEPLGKHHLIE